MKKSGLLLGASLLALTAVDVGVAYAQIDEIVVVARKREESLQNVPVAVSAFTGADLNTAGVYDLSDLGAYTPSLAREPASQGSPSGINFNLRGQRAADILWTVDPAVGTYFDGAPVTHGWGLGANFFDIDRIEVLKGPQGTLYGKNTTGGAINIYPKKADYDGMHGYVQVDVGNHSNLDWGGGVNVPIVDDMLAIRAAFQRSKRDGYQDMSGQTYAIAGGLPQGVTAGTQDLGDDDEWSFRGNMRFDPFENVRVSVTGDVVRIRENGQASKLAGWLLPSTIAPSTAEGTRQAASELFGVQVAALTGAQLAATDAFILSNLVGTGNVDVNDSGSLDNYANFSGHSITGSLEIDLAENVTLRSITSYRTMEEDRNTEIDGLLFIVHDSPQFASGKAFTQEFNLLGETLDGKLDWIGGVFYNTEEGEDGSFSTARPAVSTFPTARIDGDVQNKSWALFGQFTYDLMENLHLTAGGRYTEETRELTSRTRALGRGGSWDPVARTFTLNGSALCLTGAAPLFVPVDMNGIDCQTTLPPLQAEGWSWLASLDYEVTDDVMVYVKTARGFRSGGYNLRGILSPTFNPTRPEIARDVEVGLKGEFFGNRLRTNIAAYKTKYSDKQESFLRLSGGSLQTVIQNAAEAEIKGVELEVIANPIDNFTVWGTAGYMDAKYVDFPAADPNGGGLGIPGIINRGGQNFFNNGLQTTDDWTYSISGKYDWECGPVIVSPQANWNWVSSKELDPSSFYVAGAVSQPELAQVGDLVSQSYGLLNLRMDVEIPDYGVNVGFYATNVLNKETFFPGVNVAQRQYLSVFVQEPRFWGVELTKKFGNE